MALRFSAEEWPDGLDISLTPLRRVIRRSSVICNGWHRTRKHPLGYLPGESQNELLLLEFAEMDPCVTKIAAQPTKIVTADSGGRIFSHIPDYAMILCGDGVLFEAKPDDKAARPEVIERLRRSADHAMWQGYDYRLALRGEMLNDPRRASISALWRYFRPSFDERLRLCTATLLREKRTRIADLLTSLRAIPGLTETAFEQVLSLVANGHAFFDYDAPLTPDAMIRFPDRRSLPEPLVPTRRPSDPIGAEVAA